MGVPLISLMVILFKVLYPWWNISYMSANGMLFMPFSSVLNWALHRVHKAFARHYNVHRENMTLPSKLLSM